MKNLCKRKRVIERWSVHWGFCLLLLLGFMAGLVVDAAGAEWQPPTTKPPTQADLTMIGGRSLTLVIRLLNLSPYQLTLVNLVAPEAYTNTDRCTKKSIMYVPVGAPKSVPGLEGTWSQDDYTLDWAFTPSTTNTSTHPYNFVVSWDDQGGYVANSNITWLINSVYPVGHGTATQDVKLRFYFSRVNPSDNLVSDVFGYLSDITVELLDVIGVIIDPANPIAWVDAFVATKELAYGTLENINEVDTKAEKIYFGAYTLPDNDCPGCLGPAAIDLSTSGESNDGVAAQWESTAGTYASNLVVTTQVIRGYEPRNAGYTGFSDSVGDFTLPIVNVVVWDPGEFIWARTRAAAALTANRTGQQLKEALGTRDLQRYTQFVHLCNSLNPSQQRTFHKALKALRLDSPLTKQQEVLLEKMIAALLKGQTKLSPANR